jgi:hypothetical protein
LRTDGSRGGKISVSFSEGRGVGDGVGRGDGERVTRGVGVVVSMSGATASSAHDDKKSARNAKQTVTRPAFRRR